jgi:hypothetical protein
MKNIHMHTGNSLEGNYLKLLLYQIMYTPIIDGIQMSLWGIAWLTCLCGSMEDAWRQNCRLALERNSLGSSIPTITYVVWDVENMWLQNNLIWISSCREMKGVWDLKIKKTRKFYGLRTHKTHHGWQQLQ